VDAIKAEVKAKSADSMQSRKSAAWEAYLGRREGWRRGHSAMRSSKPAWRTARLL